MEEGLTKSLSLLCNHFTAIYEFCQFWDVQGTCLSLPAELWYHVAAQLSHRSAQGQIAPKIKKRSGHMAPPSLNLHYAREACAHAQDL